MRFGAPAAQSGEIRKRFNAHHWTLNQRFQGTYLYCCCLRCVSRLTGRLPGCSFRIDHSALRGQGVSSRDGRVIRWGAHVFSDNVRHGQRWRVGNRNNEARKRHTSSEYRHSRSQSSFGFEPLCRQFAQQHLRVLQIARVETPHWTTRKPEQAVRALAGRTRTASASLGCYCGLETP
jgi:hypothetical protein